MRIIVNGQQAFGKAVLEALLERGEDVVAAYCAPDKEGRPADPLKALAVEKGLTVLQPASFKGPDVADQMTSLEPDLCVMAYVILLVPQAVLDIPQRGDHPIPSVAVARASGAQFHQLAHHPGKDSNRPDHILPDEKLDEGPILLQKEVEIGPDDSLGSIYFNHLFPMGVDAMLEAVDLVRDGKAPRIEQDHARATYESWCRKADVGIDWSRPVAEVYNLIRGANPQPGAWTTRDGNTLQVFDCRPAEGDGAPGTVVALSDDGFAVAASGGRILVQRVRPEGGGKVPAAAYASESGLAVGTVFGGD